MSKHRSWCFTHHTAVFSGEAFFDAESWPGLKLLVYQLEEAPDTGALHLQGYIEFNNPRALSGVKSLPGMGAQVHLEPRRGTGPQSVAYCSKDESRVAGPWWWPDKETCMANCAKQGTRSDLLDVKRKIEEGETEKELFNNDETFPLMIRYHKNLMIYKRICAPERNWLPTLVSIIGPSGCGKTRWCFENYPGAYIHPGGKWWDGYDGQETVILDEMHGGHFPFRMLLKILDRYPMLVEVKGGYVPLVPRQILITANSDPANWYQGIGMNWKDSPLRRRLEGGVVYFVGHSDPIFVPRYALATVLLDIPLLEGQEPVVPLPLADYPVIGERVLAFGDAVHRYPFHEGEPLEARNFDDPAPNIDV